MTAARASGLAAGEEVTAHAGRDRPSSPGATLAAIWVAVVGVISYMFLPLIVGGLADDHGFSSRQLGFIGAAEAGGMGIANGVAAVWIRRWNWRVVIPVASLVMIGANLASIGVATFGYVVLVRLIDGLAGGVLIAIGVACQSDHPNANRIFGYFIALEMVVSSIGFLVLPMVRDNYGLDGIFVALMGIAATGMIAGRVHPPRGLDRTGKHSANGAGDAGLALSVVALVGGLLFFMSQGGLWAFIERIGVASRLPAGDIGRALAISSAFGILGALGAERFARRSGLLAAFLAVLAGELVCMVMLHGAPGTIRYTAAVCLFILFWSLGLPLLLSQFNALDGTGRLVVLLYAMGKLGYTAGPAVAGLLVRGSDFTRVLALSGALCTAGIGIAVGLAAWTVVRRTEPAGLPLTGG
jgi:predicted MFS family arabinose efflux permease